MGGQTPKLTVVNNVTIPVTTFAIQMSVPALTSPQMEVTGVSTFSVHPILNLTLIIDSTFTLGDDLSVGSITQQGGTFTTSNHALTLTSWEIQQGTVSLGSSIITQQAGTGPLSGVAGTITLQNVGNVTLNAGTSTLVMSSNGGKMQMLAAGGNQTLNFHDIHFTISGILITATTGYTFGFHDFTVDLGQEVDFTNGTFVVNGAFTVVGGPLNPCILSGTAAWFINSPTNSVLVDYVSVKNSHASGVTPFADAGGTDLGGNVNWVFRGITTQNKTISGVANIHGTDTKTIPGKARVSAIVIRTIAGVSRVQKENDRTITGKATIIPVSPWLPDPTPFFYSGPLLTTAMYSYFIEVRDQFGHLVAILDRPMNKEFTLYRNKSGSCRFELDIYDPQADPSILQKGIYDIVIRRRGIPVFAGQITYAEPNIDNSDKGTVVIMATGYLDLFLNRMVTSSFPFYDGLQNQLVFGATDSASVIATMIDYAQFPINQDGYITMQNTTTYNQSFVAPGSANVLKLKLLLRQIFSPSGNIVIGLYTDSGGFPGTLVPNSQVTVPVGSLDPSQFFQYEVDYSPTYPVLVQGTTYWVQAHLDTVQSGSNGVAWGYLNGDYLPNGKAYSSGFAFSADQDLKFWIYLDDNSFEQTENTYWGILEGGLPVSFNIEPVFSEFKKVQNIIDETTKLHSGVDFDIEVQIDVNNVMRKYYNIFYPQQGSDKTSLLFSWPGGNIIKLGKKQDSTTIVNKQYTRGQGTGIYQQVATSIVQSSVRQYGLRESNDDFSDIPDLATLQSIGDENVRVRSVPLDVPEFTIDGNKPGGANITQFSIGDTIRITSRGPGFTDFQADYRVEQMHVTISDNGEELVRITNSLA